MTPFARQNSAAERFLNRDESFLAPVDALRNGEPAGVAALVFVVILFFCVGLPALLGGL